MKIIICSPNPGIIDRVKAELRATDATFDCRQVDQGDRTVFTGIVWDNMGMSIGTAPFWTFGISLDGQSDSLRLWARSNVKVPGDRRQQVDEVLRRANDWEYGDGRFAGVNRTNAILYSIPPVTLEDLPYGLRGEFEGVDDALGKVTPGLRKVMGIQDR